MKSHQINEANETRYVCEDDGQIEEFKELVGQRFMCVHDLTRPNSYGDSKPRETWMTAGEVFNVNAVLFAINKDEMYDEYVKNVDRPTDEERVLIELGLLEPVEVEFYTLKIDPPSKSHNNILPNFKTIGEFWERFRVYHERSMMTESMGERTRYMYVDTDGSLHLIPISLNLEYFQSIIGKTFKCKKDFNNGRIRTRSYVDMAVGYRFTPKLIQVLVKTENDDRFFSANQIRVATDDEVLMADLQIIPTIKLGDIEVQVVGKTKESPNWSKRFPYKQKFLDHFVEVTPKVNESSEIDVLYELGLISEFEKMMSDLNFRKIEEPYNTWYEKSGEPNTIIVDDNNGMYVITTYSKKADVDQKITSDLDSVREIVEEFIAKYQAGKSINESDEEDLLISLGIVDPFEQLMDDLGFKKKTDTTYEIPTERGKRFVIDRGNGKYQTVAYGWYDDGDGNSYEDEDDDESFDSLDALKRYLSDEADPLHELRQYLTDTLGRIAIR